MPTPGPLELVIILVIALLVLGPGKLPEVGKSLGQSIREFRKASSDVQESINVNPAPPPAPAPAAPTAPAGQVEAAPVAAAVAAPAVVSAPAPEPVAAATAASEPTAPSN